MAGECSVDDCHAAKHANGMCARHYMRWKKHGDPSINNLPNRGKARDFFDDLISTNETVEGCIIWPFSRDDKGSAQLVKGGVPRKVGAILCECKHGPRPDVEGKKFKAIFECGNGTGGCCNPSHVFWGEQKDVEAVKAGNDRDNQGERNGKHKLLENEIPDIRLASLSMSDSEIAQIYGVSRKAISYVRTKRTWKHVE